MKNTLSIGELSKRSGVAPSALRFYEERGLIQSERNPSGHRRFARPVLRRLAFIVFAQRIGLTLQEVRAELAQLPLHQVPTASDWAKLSRTWNDRIGQQIAQLELLRSGLTDCIGCGCLSFTKCKFANPLDRAACYTSGPLVWNAPPRSPVTAAGKRKLASVSGAALKPNSRRS